jgi:hypothetical protein
MNTDRSSRWIGASSAFHSVRERYADALACHTRGETGRALDVRERAEREFERQIFWAQCVSLALGVVADLDIAYPLAMFPRPRPRWPTSLGHILTRWHVPTRIRFEQRVDTLAGVAILEAHPY